MAIESMYVFTGDEVVATDLPAKLNENFAKTETNMLKTVNNMLKTVNNVAQDENHNINVTELIPKRITSNTNLNNLVTSGEYTFTKGSATITNSPTPNSFFLTVLRNNALVKQVVTEVVLDDPITYTRVLSGSSWSPWVEGGKVKTINSIEPDDSGNVDLSSMDYAVRSEIGIWKPSENVSVGDVRYLNGRANTGKILKCVKAGTTGSSQPSITSDAILADFSSVYRIGAVRWIYNIAEKDDDEIFATGVKYSRVTYSALWSYIQSKPALLISESEWQAKYTATGGKFVPYYSEGDGSTDFRTPLLAAYATGVTDNSKIGAFKADSSASVADLIRNHYHGFGYNNADNQGSFLATSAQQSFPLKPTSGYREWNGSGGGGGYSGDRTSYSGNMVTSLPMSVDGNESGSTSGKLHPDTMYGVWVIKAFGTIVNSNNTDIKNVLTGIENISIRMNTYESNNKFVVEVYQSGTNWCRVWSDGWIEQGGRVTDTKSSGRVTLNKPMKDTNYTIICQEGGTGIFEATDEDTGGYEFNIGITGGTTTSFRYTIVSARYFNWYVCGMGA